MQHHSNRRDKFSAAWLNFHLLYSAFNVFAMLIGTCVSFSLFGTVCILPRNTNGMCMSTVRQRSPPVFDTLVRSTLDHIHPHRSMCHCIDGHSSLECLTGDFSYKIRVTVPNTPNLCRRAIYDQDCMASIGNGIYVKQKQERSNHKYDHVSLDVFSFFFWVQFWNMKNFNQKK